MVEKLTRTQCKLKDCLYHKIINENIFCCHPDKDIVREHPCPLYSLDWKKQAMSKNKK